MSKHVVLNNIDHQNTKVISRFTAQYGDNIASIMAFPTEFLDLQKEYPILFRLDPDTNNYYSTALLGLQQDENLFLDESSDSGWRAHYVPAMLTRGPFLIGFQNQIIEGEDKKVPVIHIDMSHPKVNESEGRNLFMPQGGNSPYLEHISSVLQQIHQGMNISKAMFAAFTEMDLIEPINIEIDLNENDKKRLIGNYTINAQKLAALNGEQLAKLHHAGFLQLAFAVLASMSNLRRLIDSKNRTMNG